MTKAPRSGGSLILAAWAINRALYCDLSTGDLARIAKTENPPILPVVSVRIRNARQSSATSKSSWSARTGRNGWSASPRRTR